MDRQFENIQMTESICYTAVKLKNYKQIKKETFKEIDENPRLNEYFKNLILQNSQLIQQNNILNEENYHLRAKNQLYLRALQKLRVRLLSMKSKLLVVRWVHQSQTNHKIQIDKENYKVYTSLQQILKDSEPKLIKRSKSQGKVRGRI